MWARELLTPWHLLILLAIALVLFGPGRLPELGRSLGQSMREFRSAVSGDGGGQGGPAQPPAAADGSGTGRDPAEKGAPRA
jgi:sec-independent protein translocase protein TatA